MLEASSANILRAQVLQENSSYPLGYGERKDVIQMNNLLLASQDLTCFRDAEKFSVRAILHLAAVLHY